MAAVQRRCSVPTCRRKFTPRRGTRREKCYDCSPERTKAVREAEAAAAVPAPVSTATADVVRAELERCGQLGTVQGVVALRLAEALDSRALKPGEVAAMSEKLLKVMEPLQRLGPREPDRLDEFSERLAAKRASA